jgi:hypothetical protein
VPSTRALFKRQRRELVSHTTERPCHETIAHSQRQLIIDSSLKNVSGSISPSIGALTALTWLCVDTAFSLISSSFDFFFLLVGRRSEIRGNHVVGTIPSQVGNLTRLRNL